MTSPPNDMLPLEASAAMPAPLAGNVAAIRLDAQGRIVDATVSAAAMLGYEPTDLHGHTLSDLALEGWQAAAEVATARVRFGATESFELALKGRSGRRTLVEMTAGTGSNGAAGVVVAWSERRARRPAGARDGDPDLKRIAYGLLRIQESERMRVALQLHDEVSPIVIMVKYMIEDAVGRIGPGVAGESVAILSDATVRLRDVIAELRRISTELRPKLLDDLGLVPALAWYCRGIEETVHGVRVECRLTAAEADIPDDLKLDIFRVVQEALSNVIEHAHARHAQVSLFLALGELRVTIEDDGEGFDPATVASKRDGGLNLGLQSIRKRIEATGGSMQIESKGQRGTRVSGAWRLAAFADNVQR